eukprot:589411-Prymnesium_polylepis.1
MVMTAVNSSGADDPAAMKVAPATSSLRLSAPDICSSDSTKYSSHTIASPRNVYMISANSTTIPVLVSYGVLHSSLPKTRATSDSSDGWGAGASSRWRRADSPTHRSSPANKRQKRRPAPLHTNSPTAGFSRSRRRWRLLCGRLAPGSMVTTACSEGAIF